MKLHVDGTIFAEQPRGGISRIWSNLLRRLPDHGVDVHLYLPHVVAQEVDLPEAVNITKFPRRLSLRPGRVLGTMADRKYRRELEKMWSLAREGLFHSTHFTTCSTLRVPQVVTVYDLFHECLADCFSEHESRPFTLRRRNCINAARGIIAISRATLADVDRLFHFPDVPKRAIALAVEPQFRAFAATCDQRRPIEREFADGGKYLLYVGARYPYKNFAGLLAGYAAWGRRSEYRLVVIGPPASPAENALIRGFGIGTVVRFHAPTSDEALARAYNGASAVVVPSLSEGFGLPIWEAMACKSPVVAARAGAMPEVGGRTPVYFDHGSPLHLAAALDEAVAIPRDGTRLAEGVLHATRRTWDDVAREHVEFYHEVAQAASRRQPPKPASAREQLPLAGEVRVP